MINKGSQGAIMKGRDKHTDIICWDIEWNGFLWLLALLQHCINDPLNNQRPQQLQSQQQHDTNLNQSFAISKHNIAYMSHHTLPSAMRLLTRLTYYYPEAIGLIVDDIKLVYEAGSTHRRRHFISQKRYIRSHSKKLCQQILNNGGINLMSFQLFTHCMREITRI